MPNRSSFGGLCHNTSPPRSDHSPFPPSKQNEKKKKRKKRGKGAEEPKTARLPIHQEKVIKPKKIPAGASFKGYQEYFIQDIQFGIQNILFKLERWQTTDGTYCTGTLPQEYLGYHFGPTLRTFIAYQYHHARVTRPRLLEQLRDLGIEISKTELNKIILDQSKVAIEEMQAILETAIKHSSYIQTEHKSGDLPRKSVRNTAKLCKSPHPPLLPHLIPIVLGTKIQYKALQ